MTAEYLEIVVRRFWIQQFGFVVVATSLGILVAVRKSKLFPARLLGLDNVQDIDSRSSHV